MQIRSSYPRVRARIAAGVVVSALFALPGFAPPPDGVDLRVERGPLASQITLNWVGGQPTFDVYRSSSPVNVTDPGNLVTSTGVRTFSTGQGADTISFFVVSSPCVVNPPEVCDGADNDCNGIVDGPGSESSCSVPNATPACSAGACVIGSCDVDYFDCNASSTDGCERDILSFQEDLLNCGSCNNVCLNRPNSSPDCSFGNCGFFCDPGYFDCNIMDADGCEIDITTNVQHCGGCGSPCPNVPNAVPSCVASTCEIACVGGFHDCDEDLGNGCEVTTADLDTDSFNCGGCGVTCTLPNAVGVCAGGSCQAAVASCNTNFYDINGNPADGCEYGCTFTSSTDLPDDAFTDANCDGIDGDVAKAVFVSTAGNDVNPGTMAQPKLTINAAIGTAVGLPGKTEVYISEGTYFQRVSMENGISLYGGYRATAGWSRSAGFIAIIQGTSAIAGRMNALECNGVTSPTRLDQLQIRTDHAPPGGISNYGVYATGCTGLSISNCTIIAGNGSAGTNAGPALPGANGNTGGSGQPGSCNGPNGAGGAGGTSSCGRNGGKGGNGGAEGANNGAAGNSGAGGTSGGAGGLGGNPGGDGANAAHGATGSPGTSGSGGNGGSVVGGFWSGNSGSNGAIGNPGNGGGGGGGGGGQGCLLCNDGGGNGAGAGGAGGCGGTGAMPGTAGGGSFSVFLVNSSGSSITSSTLVSGLGGSGGSGSAGGTGGFGGGPGGGGGNCLEEVGRGGSGGVGGSGGQGGHGGGGAGGPSWSVYRSATVVTLTGNTFSPGAGGPGGSSPGNPGVTGASGPVF